MGRVQISPSILSADFARLGEEVRAIDEAGADMIHIDVMDGDFVPNLTLGPPIIKALRPHTDKLFDCHLMISSADQFVEAFAAAGADILTVHPEACPHVHRTVQSIRAAGMRPGVAINPGSPISLVEPVIGDVDLVLIMTVNPGFGGQKFIDSQLRKIRQVREMIAATGRDVMLEVDGGLTPETAPRAVEAGADVIVAGSAVFKGGESKYAGNIEALRPRILV